MTVFELIREAHRCGLRLRRSPVGTLFAARTGVKSWRAATDREDVFLMVSYWPKRVHGGRWVITGHGPTGSFKIDHEHEATLPRVVAFLAAAGILTGAGR